MPNTYTPGGLTVGKLGNNADQWALYREEDGRDVAYIVFGGEATAQRLARADNAHDELVGALESFLFDASGDEFDADSEIERLRLQCAAFMKRRKAARVLLARLKGA